MGKTLKDWRECRGDVTLVFLHIPKTAGSTLGAIIAANYDPSVVFRVESPIVASLRRFRSLAFEEKRRLRVVMGHGVSGIHEELPRSCVCLTLLRDPIDRVVSNYYFIRSSPRHRLHDRVVKGNMSLTEYVEQGVNRQMDNGQVRAIATTCAGAGHDEDIDACTAEMLETARTRLRDAYALVGLTERFDESLLLARKCLGWRHPYYSKRKVTRRRPALTEVPVEARRAIRERNLLDIELYGFAAELLKQRIREQGALFPITVFRFKLLNRLVRGH